VIRRLFTSDELPAPVTEPGIGKRDGPKALAGEKSWGLADEVLSLAAFLLLLCLLLNKHIEKEMKVLIWTRQSVQHISKQLSSMTYMSRSANDTFVTSVHGATSNSYVKRPPVSIRIQGSRRHSTCAMRSRYCRWSTQALEKTRGSFCIYSAMPVVSPLLLSPPP
jgi:hypothetical protein